MAVQITHAEVLRRMKRKEQSLFTVIDRGKQRKGITEKEVSALQSEGLSRSQADALAYVGLCGGEASWVEMQFARISTKSIAILEERDLVVRAVEYEMGPWAVSGGYVWLTRRGTRLLKKVIAASNDDRVAAGIQSGRVATLRPKKRSSAVSLER